MPMATITKQPREQDQARPARRRDRSAPLIAQRPGDIRRRAEDEHRPRAEDVEVRPCDRGADEIGDQPRLDAFDLAGRDGFLQAVQMAVAAGEDHATDGVLVQRIDEIGDRLMLDVDLGHDLHLHDLLRSESVPQLMHVVRRAGEDHAFAQILAHGALAKARDADALAQEQEHTVARTTKIGMTARLGTSSWRK